MKDTTAPLISIIIPCYNEKRFILEVITRVRNSAIPNKEIIIIDDYSTDGTREIIKEKIEPEVAKVIYHEKNMGKGAALRNGFKEATGEIIIIQDADLELDPNDHPKLVQPIIEDKADVVYGSRFKELKKEKKLPSLHLMVNRFLTFTSNFFSGLKLTDMETCYKIFKREIIHGIELEENRFGFEPEITAKLAKLNCRICEVAVSYNKRSYGAGKKIGWKDGIRALWCILKYNSFRKK